MRDLFSTGTGGAGEGISEINLLAYEKKRRVLR